MKLPLYERFSTPLRFSTFRSVFPSQTSLLKSLAFWQWENQLLLKSSSDSLADTKMLGRVWKRKEKKQNKTKEKQEFQRGTRTTVKQRKRMVVCHLSFWGPSTKKEKYINPWSEYIVIRGIAECVVLILVCAWAAFHKRSTQKMLPYEQRRGLSDFVSMKDVCRSLCNRK